MSASKQAAKKVVWREFYCPGCRGRILREVAPNSMRHKSFCSTVGKDTVMRRVKHPIKMGLLK